MKIGILELLVIFVVALLVIGPDELPKYAKMLGEALRQFKKYSSEATKEIRESVIEPMEEAQQPLREAMEPINDLTKSVNDEVKDLKKSFSDIGKPTRKRPEPEEEQGQEHTASEKISGEKSGEPETFNTASSPGEPLQEEQNRQEPSPDASVPLPE